MVKRFNNFKINENLKDQAEAFVDNILDKIGKVGYKFISDLEKEILKKVSENGIESIYEYIEDDEPKLGFDKLGGITIDNVPYSEYQIKKQPPVEKKEGSWNRLKDKKEKHPFIITAYKNDNSKTIHYLIYFIDDRLGTVKKYTTESTDENPYGVFTLSKAWQNKNLDDLHDNIFSKQFDQYKRLNFDELNEFDTFMTLRIHFKNGKLDQNQKKILDDLYNKLRNI